MVWRVQGGVARLGSCEDCNTLFIEMEKPCPKTHYWFDQDKWFEKVKLEFWLLKNRERVLEVESKIGDFFFRI